jgi:hypothetical protein
MNVLCTTLLLLVSTASAFLPSILAPARQTTVLPAAAAAGMTRFEFISTIMTTTAAATVSFFPMAASAKEIDPAIKGTKADPVYQNCVSVCMYECTKPKADEQKTRQECLPECKVKCATNKAQLMIGVPNK